MTNLRIELLDRARDRPRIEVLWKCLTERCGSYFLTWRWIEHWLASLPDEAAPRLVVIFQDNRPVLGFFLGEQRVTRHKVLSSRGLFVNTTGVSEYDALYIEYNAIPRVPGANLSLDQIVRVLPIDWEELYLPGLDCTEFPGNCIGEMAGVHAVKTQYRASPQVDLRLVRNTPGGYRALRDSQWRSSLRRATRGYDGSGVTLTAAESVRAALAIYDELVEMHQRSWQARGQPGAFASRFFFDFHRTYIGKNFHQGSIQLLKIAAADRTIACNYNFVYAGKVYFYQSGRAHEDDPRRKPGIVAHVEAIEYNARLGHNVYDFLAGGDHYKSRLATGEGRLVWATVQRARAKFWVEDRLRTLKERLGL